MSVLEREKPGKAVRKLVPRSSHGAWEPAEDRPDPIDILEEQARSRVPELCPIRYGRMLVSPFTFFRGAAAIMAADLAATPQTGFTVQLCGDAHLSNFGFFGSPERELLFDINDFDETLPGPWEWDVKRLAASLAVAGRENGYPRNMRRRIVRKTVAEYQKWMNRFADMGNLDVWYAHFNADALHLEFYPRIAKAQVTMVEQSIAKARTRDNIHELEKLTVVINGERRIISDPPLIVPVEELVQGAERKALEAIIRQGIRSYRRTLVSDRKYLLDEYQYVHLARKVVGVGSVGLRAWIVLFHGRDNGDPLFLQVKEAQPSILEPHAAKSKFRNHGQRVVSGQRLMQAASDIFLGWGRMTIQNGDVHDFYVRQLKDWKGSFHVESMTPEGMELYGRMCGWTLARAHARSGERVAIAGYLGSGKMFQNAIAAFSEAYADQNERDYLKLVEASKAGRINAELGL